MLSTAFFNSARKSPFGGSLVPSAIVAMNALDLAWTALPAPDTVDLDLDQFGYVLATVLNECGATMLPVAENLNYSAQRMVQVWPNKITPAQAPTYAHNPEKLGNHVYAGIIGNGDEASGDGYRFRGRGFSQLTGRANYVKFGALIGEDLIGNPDRLLDPAIGAKVLIVGMRDGLFTGKKLGDFFSRSKQDPIHARSIVNGDVSANGQKIAGFWNGFRGALSAADVPSSSPTPPEPAPATPPAVARAPDPIMKGWQQKLIDAGFPLPKFGADGYGGAETQSAIKDFQTAHEIPVTGQFDDATRRALNPPPATRPSLSSALETILMFPTIVQLLITILPGVPDDIKLVENEIRELASTDSGIKKLRTALVFAEALIDRGQAILDEIDPQGAIQPPASQVAISKP